MNQEIKNAIENIAVNKNNPAAMMAILTDNLGAGDIKLVTDLWSVDRPAETLFLIAAAEGAGSGR